MLQVSYTEKLISRAVHSHQNPIAITSTSMNAVQANHPCTASKSANVCKQPKGLTLFLLEFRMEYSPDPPHPLYYNLHPMDVAEMPLITRNSSKRGLAKKEDFVP